MNWFGSAGACDAVVAMVHYALRREVVGRLKGRWWGVRNASSVHRECWCPCSVVGGFNLMLDGPVGVCG